MSDAIRITIEGWRDHQHYSDRNPPWIKLHSKLLENAEWGVLPGDAAKLLVDLWLTAAKAGTEGVIETTVQKLEWRTRHDSGTLAGLLKCLQDNGFIVYASTSLAPCKQPSSASSIEVRGTESTEDTEELPEEQRSDVNTSSVESGGDSTPVKAMHATFVDILGGQPPHPTLTDTRRAKYRALWSEHLSELDDWRPLWRSLLLAITDSDHHMGQRSYQMPESFLRNPERRDRWIQEAAGRVNGRPGLTDADRKLIRRRRELSEIDYDASESPI